jgi:hypothetical protein
MNRTRHRREIEMKGKERRNVEGKWTEKEMGAIVRRWRSQIGVVKGESRK